MICTTLSDRAAVSSEGIKIETGAVSGLNMIATRLSPGAISESSSSHLPPSVASTGGEPGDVPTREGGPRDDAAGDGVAHVVEADRDRRGLRLEGNDRRGRVCQDDVGSQTDQLLRERSYPIGVTAAPPKVHPHVAAIGPTQFRKRLNERRVATVPLRIVFVVRHEHADVPHALALLRSRRARPRHRRAAEQRYELALVHSVISQRRTYRA